MNAANSNTSVQTIVLWYQLDPEKTHEDWAGKNICEENYIIEIMKTINSALILDILQSYLVTTFSAKVWNPKKW